MKGDRKFLVAVLYGVGMIGALVLIIVLKQFTPENFKVWLGGFAGMFTLFNTANVVSKFSPEAAQPITVRNEVIVKPKKVGLLKKLFKGK